MTELRKSDMDEDASQDSDQDDEMGFVTASLMKPEQYEKQDKEVSYQAHSINTASHCLDHSI